MSLNCFCVQQQPGVQNKHGSICLETLICPILVEVGKKSTFTNVQTLSFLSPVPSGSWIEKPFLKAKTKLQMFYSVT